MSAWTRGGSGMRKSTCAILLPRTWRHTCLVLLLLASCIQGTSTGLVNPLHLIARGGGDQGSAPVKSHPPVQSLGETLLKKGSVKPSTRSIPVLRIDGNGFAVETTVSRQMLAHELGCPLRDLRVVDPTFPSQFPAVIVRPGAIIVSLASVKAIIKAGEMLLFPSEPDIMSITPNIQEKLMAGEMGPNGLVPFEHIALECCLSHVCSTLQDSVHTIEPRLRKVLGTLGAGAGPPLRSVRTLLPLKNHLDNLENTLVEVCKCMNDVLLNDEDMSLMYLTEARERMGEVRDPSQHQEVEMLFENYLLEAELLRSDVRDLENTARNTEEIVEIELDVLRNRILRFELILSISGLTVSLGALVTGVFGMNLLSGWEEHRGTFWLVTTMIYGGMIVSLLSTVAFCRRNKLL